MPTLRPTGLRAISRYSRIEAQGVLMESDID